MVRSPRGCCRMTAQYLYDFTGTARAANGSFTIHAIVARTYDLRTIVLAQTSIKNRAFSARSAHNLCTMAVRGLFDATCDISTGYRLIFFQTCHKSSLNKIVEIIARFPYDIRTASVRLGSTLAFFGWRLWYFQGHNIHLHDFFVMDLLLS